MAGLKYDAMERLEFSFEQIAFIPTDVISGILEKQAKLIHEAIRAEASKLRAGYYDMNWNARDNGGGFRGPQTRSYTTGQTARSVQVSPPEPDRKTGLTKVDVYFRGTRAHGTGRVVNTLVAFMNEYGSKNINARHFVWKAVVSVDAAVTKIAEDGIDAWLKKHDL